MNNIFHLIDDEEMLRDLLETIIFNAGYGVRCFDFAEHYLQYLHSAEYEKPIAVLTDVKMPGMSGYELAIEIRKTHPLLKIALITGYADNEHHQFAASQLCYTVAKPSQPKKLISLLAALAACEHAHEAGDKCEYFQRCEFGIDHDCPFYHSKGLHDGTDVTGESEDIGEDDE